MKRSDTKVGVISKLALMIAVSCVFVLIVRVPYPPAPFLVYDPADVPIYIATFAFGPGAGLLLTAVVSLIQAFVLGGDGVYGFLMHFLATGAFVIVSGVIYKFNKTKKGALIAFVSALVAMVAVMCLANLIVTPIFLGVPRQAVIPMLLPIIIPFNLIKGGVNGMLTFMVYKKLSPFLHGSKWDKN